MPHLDLPGSVPFGELEVWFNLFRNLEFLVAVARRTETKLDNLGAMIMATSAENRAALEAAVTAVQSSLDGIAADIADLSPRIGTGMSQADVDALKTAFQSVADRASSIDAQNPAPAPVPPTA